MKKNKGISLTTYLLLLLILIGSMTLLVLAIEWLVKTTRADPVPTILTKEEIIIKRDKCWDEGFSHWIEFEMINEILEPVDSYCRRDYDLTNE